MGIQIDRVEAEVTEPATSPPSIAPAAQPREPAPLDLTDLLQHLAERAARHHAE
jgi:hypothetical protein